MMKQLREKHFLANWDVPFLALVVYSFLLAKKKIIISSRGMCLTWWYYSYELSLESNNTFIMLATKRLWHYVDELEMSYVENKPTNFLCCFLTQTVTETYFPYQEHMWCTCQHLTQTTTPRRMEWSATGYCPKLRTALFRICSPSTVRPGTSWRWPLDLIVRSVFLILSKPNKTF